MLHVKNSFTATDLKELRRTLFVVVGEYSIFLKPLVSIKLFLIMISTPEVLANRRISDYIFSPKDLIICSEKHSIISDVTFFVL